MGLATSPGFFQRRMEAIFTQYLWNFVLDDISKEETSRSPPNYFIHFEQLWDITLDMQM